MPSKLLPDSKVLEILKGEAGNTRNILLIALLLLVSVFGYIYLFTDLIRSPEGGNKPAVQVTQVKKPIPPRAEQGALAPAQTKQDAQAPQPQPGKPATSTEVAAKPPAAPEAETQTKPADVKKPQPQSSPPPQAKAQVATPAKPESKEVKKPAKTGAYTLLVGEFILDKSIKHEKAVLKKLGITPVKQMKVNRVEPMTRLMVGAYSDRETAEAQLAKLKKLQGDGFLLIEGGKFVLYAGSYYLEGRAAVAQDKLYDNGFKTVMKKTKVSVPLIRLTAGSYASQDDAQKALTLLKQKGINARIIASGR